MMKFEKELIIMPGRDGTGPMGSGSMTGRSLGICSGVNAAMYGAGRGIRAGRGANNWRNRSFLEYPIQGIGTEKTPKEILEAQKEAFQKRVDSINKQLDVISKETAPSAEE